MLSECKANKSKGIKVMIYFYVIVVSEWVRSVWLLVQASDQVAAASKHDWLSF